MKAPTKFDKQLRSEGFGYAKPYYLRFNSESKTIESWIFGKNPEGMTLQTVAFYPVSESSIAISPMELQYLCTDGSLAGSPHLDGNSGYWPKEFEAALFDSMTTIGKRRVAQLSDSEMMIGVYESLVYSVESAVSAAEFPYLADPLVRRGITPNRLRGFAGYLNLEGKYTQADAMLRQIPPQLFTEADEKMSRDSAAAQIHVSNLTLDFLRRSGARVE